MRIVPFGAGVVLVGWSIAYVADPHLFQRWSWQRVTLAQRLLSPAGYVRFMRVAGAVYVVGLGLCAYGGSVR